MLSQSGHLATHNEFFWPMDNCSALACDRCSILRPKVRTEPVRCASTVICATPSSTVNPRRRDEQRLGFSEMPQPILIEFLM